MTHHAMNNSVLVKNSRVEYCFGLSFQCPVLFLSLPNPVVGSFWDINPGYEIPIVDKFLSTGISFLPWILDPFKICMTIILKVLISKTVIM